MIQYEQEVIKHLGLPSVPKKEWDGKSAFKSGVAVLHCYCDIFSYAVASFDPERDKEPRITKVFGCEPFIKVDKIFVVPSYMNDDVETFDLDEESKKNAEALVNEASVIENEGSEEITEPENEYYFEGITNDEEAAAYIASYNKANKIKNARVPKSHDGLIMRLASIHSAVEKKKVK